MWDRESHFADETVVELLSAKFVPVAVDEWYHIRRKDDEGDFYRKIVYQREGMKPGRTTQGFYVCAPDGTLLVGWNNRDVPKMQRHLRKALEGYEPPETGELKQDEDRAYARPVPEGGAVVDLFTRSSEIRTMGRDHLWITKSEIDALAKGTLPDALARRIARYHLVDNTRGEPPHWKRDEIRESTFALKDGVLTGSVKLGGEERGYEAKIDGRVEMKDGRLARFDLVVRGEFWGEGIYTPGAPKGKFPLSIAFTLEGEGEASRVPPQGARDVRDYLQP